ncbi:MAG TPA: molybdopterin cofactor-binding domain-containing protein, partial [Caulobacteraceae bacterium]
MPSVTDYAIPNPVSENKGGVIGRPVDRYEGPLKVSGTAPYSYEVQTPSPPAYGYIVGAEIGCGRVVAVEDAQALAAPGVKLVWHPFRTPAQAQRGAKVNPHGQAAAEPVFADGAVRFWGQPVAFVAADTAENAREAAALLRLRYVETPAEFGFDPLKAQTPGGDEDVRLGDFEGAFAAAPVRIDSVFTTPVQNHCQMEPCATTAWFEGDTLVVHTSNQSIKAPQHLLAETLQIHREKVHLMSRYIGGGFGGKGSNYEDLTLAALAARDLGQPVKVAFTRQQMFHASIHRPATVQRVRLGATPDGRLTAFALEAATHSARREHFTEHAASFSRALYAAPNRLTGHRVARLDIPVAG